MKLHKLPEWMPMAGSTFLTKNHIWLKDGLPSWVLEHEKVHLDQVQYGGWRFRLRYLFSPEARFQAEAEAYAVSVAMGDSLEECSGYLASWLYLKCCTKVQARNLIMAYMALLPTEGRIFWEPHQRSTPYIGTSALN
jgi:hypothetical protein